MSCVANNNLSWTCPACRTEVQTPFCPQCGEKPLQPRDVSLRGVAAKLLHATTSVDGRVMRTFARLLLRPGVLTVAYMRGERKAWIAPFQLFLLANGLFFAIQSLTGINVFASTLDSHLHHQDWSAIAQSMVTQRLALSQTPLDAYAPLFDRAVAIYAKTLIILMVLPFALLLALVYAEQRKPLLTHLSFALHLYAFLMLLFSLANLGVGLSAWLGGPGLDSPRLDNVVSSLLLLACAAYINRAARAVFTEPRWLRAARAVLLALVAAALVLGYRFAIFLVTFYAT
jgi:Protein of unknown function (DUF3667)